MRAVAAAAASSEGLDDAAVIPVVVADRLAALAIRIRQTDRSTPPASDGADYTKSVVLSGEVVGGKSPDWLMGIVTCRCPIQGTDADMECREGSSQREPQPVSAGCRLTLKPINCGSLLNVTITVDNCTSPMAI